MASLSLAIDLKSEDYNPQNVHLRLVYITISAFRKRFCMHVYMHFQFVPVWGFLFIFFCFDTCLSLFWIMCIFSRQKKTAGSSFADCTGTDRTGVNLQKFYKKCIIILDEAACLYTQEMLQHLSYLKKTTANIHLELLVAVSPQGENFFPNCQWPCWGTIISGQ